MGLAGDAKHMLLFATGFNACGQLSYSSSPQDPDDLFGFTAILEAERIERPVARLSYTQGACVTPAGPADNTG